MLIDTGFSINIIDELVNGRVYGFQNNNPLNFRGQFSIRINLGSKWINTKVAVIIGAERCLLGKDN